MFISNAGLLPAQNLSTRQKPSTNLNQATYSRDTISLTNRSPKKQAVRFGMEPMTWLALTTTAHFYRKAIDWTLSNINSNHSNLEQSSKFRNGTSYLRLANATSGKDQKEYIAKAEQNFIESSNEFNKQLYKGEAYKYVAICAKMMGREQSTIDHLTEVANDFYVKSLNNDSTIFGSDITGFRHQFNASDIPNVAAALHSSNSFTKYTWRTNVDDCVIQ